MNMELSRIKGIGPARLKALERQGITSVRELLLCLPVDYKDLTDIRPVESLRAGDVVAMRVRVTGPVRTQRVPRLTISKVRVADDSGSIMAVFYNQPWIAQQWREGMELLLYGRVEARHGQLQLSCPSVEREQGLVPVYRQMAGIPAKTLRNLIQLALNEAEGHWPDELPESLRRRHGLCERNFAMRAAHFPLSREALQLARRRLAFEELLLYQAGLSMMRGAGQRGVRIPISDHDAQGFWAAMPFSPTRAQARVLDQIFEDMRGPGQMARLVQGDVGSGKTALAFGALYAAAKNGFMGALMAPTEVLAQQHYETALALLEPLGLRCGLLTGSMTPKQKREAHQAIQDGQWDVVIGTHALITESVSYKNLGLVVTDEQHRFGVKQRTLLSEKGAVQSETGGAPHVLVMSATPIPRTLALILYGDLDVSVVDELPPGRTPVKTRIVPEAKRDGMYRFILGEVAQGRQAYVVCPLVEESEAVDAKPAEALYEELRQGPLRSVPIALVHGRMRPKDKDEVLAKFHAGEIAVLVSTTVIEVGVNVPNASVMVIENAERFGLAQLHQLRGRVGRGAAASWCFLMAEPNERLILLTQTSDGFVIAQKDMELRGPGELFGYRQTGALAAGLSGLLGDTRLLEETRDELNFLLKSPDSEETIQIMSAAGELFEKRLREVALN